MKAPPLVYIVSAILFVIAIHIFASSPPIPKFGKWLHEWQDLVAGILALVGAYWALMGIRQQIEHSEKVEARRIRRAYEGRLLTLPLVLSNAVAYAEDSIRALAKARKILRGRGNRALTGQWSPPVFPRDLAGELRAFIEASDNEQANELIAELLRQLQTLDARLMSLVKEEDIFRIGLKRNVAEYQIQASKIRQLGGVLFGFARENQEALPTSLPRDGVIQAIEFIDDDANDDADFAAMRAIFLKVEKPWWSSRL